MEACQSFRKAILWSFLVCGFSNASHIARILPPYFVASFLARASIWKPVPNTSVLVFYQSLSQFTRAASRQDTIPLVC
uniref:Putative secreted protein n=1 Tax=Panstrongylus lignarius TaxID=156445 RepID=A0A224Y3R1_9HEMI